MGKAACLILLAGLLVFVSGCESQKQFQQGFKPYIFAGYQTFEIEDTAEDTGGVIGLGLTWDVPQMLTRWTLEGWAGIGMERDFLDDTPTVDEDYFGGLGELDFIYPLAVHNEQEELAAIFTPFIGTGYRVDRRDVKDVVSTEEDWRSWYAHIGVDARHWVKEDMTLNWGLRVGTSIDNSAEVDTGSMNIEFEPDTAVRFRANIGLQWDAATLSLWYDYIGFGEDTQVEDGTTYYLPESTQSTIGLTFGWIF